MQVRGDPYSQQLLPCRDCKEQAAEAGLVGCLETNTTKVKNIRKYLLAALFNAPTTIDGYYQAEVNHNMPEFVLGHRETELNVC